MATPYDNDGQQTGRNAQEPATQRLQDEARRAKEQAKTEGESQFAHYRDSAADEVDKVARSADAAVDAMRNEDDPAGLSHYVADIASSLGNFAETLRDKSAEDLLREANRLARENPALFITGSVAIGFGLTRFMRASANHSSDAPHSTARDDFDEEPQLDTDASFAPPTARFDDLDKTPSPASADQSALPTFNPASKADRTPGSTYSGNSFGNRGDLHS